MPTPDHIKQKIRQRRDDLKSRGLCTDCGKFPLATDSTLYCEAHRDKRKRRLARRRDRRTGAGLCVKCGTNPTPPDNSKCQECSTQDSQYHCGRRDDLKAAGLCTDCGREPIASGTNCVGCREKRLAVDRRKHEKFKALALAHYGVCCAVCGVSHPKFLTFDHIDGGGLRHRREERVIILAEWLVRNNYPAGFQVLCWNHNFLKHLERPREHSKRPASIRMREYLQECRRKVIEAYGGPVCSCCGETDARVLAIDHVNGDGAEHRRAIGRSSSNLWRWLRNNGFPDGFRVLCFNCNSGRHANGGTCPHKTTAVAPPAIA